MEVARQKGAVAHSYETPDDTHSAAAGLDQSYSVRGNRSETVAVVADTAYSADSFDQGSSADYSLGDFHKKPSRFESCQRLPGETNSVLALKIRLEIEKDGLVIQDSGHKD